MLAFPLEQALADEASRIKISLDGMTMLQIRWSEEDYEILTFKPGEWEKALFRALERIRSVEVL